MHRFQILRIKETTHTLSNKILNDAVTACDQNQGTESSVPPLSRNAKTIGTPGEQDGFGMKLNLALAFWFSLQWQSTNTHTL